jgi:hypothetical protein
LSLKFAVLSAISLGCLCDCAAYNDRDFLFLKKLKTDFVLGSAGTLEAVVKGFFEFSLLDYLNKARLSRGRMILLLPQPLIPPLSLPTIISSTRDTQKGCERETTC